MPPTGFGLAELQSYRPQTTAPPDFDDFWRRTLAEARSYGGTVKADPVTDRFVPGQRAALTSA